MIFAEAQHALNICNICNYCNGFCDLFDAARRRGTLTNSDLEYLASLCHHCRNCFYACQYAPPHVFNINLPKILAQLRWEFYRQNTWPASLAIFFIYPQLIIGVVISSIILMLGWVWCTVPRELLFKIHLDAGAFYQIISLKVMILLGIFSLGWAMIAISVEVSRFWRSCYIDSMQALTIRALMRAVWDIAILRNLHGGGAGCNDLNENFSSWRSILHHALFYGFLSCLGATASAAWLEHFLNLQAPYLIKSLPVMLGIFGGGAMLFAIFGFFWLHKDADQRLLAFEAQRGEIIWLCLLGSVVLTGFLVLWWRSSAAMGLILAIHLGLVWAFFLLLPYSKFMHSVYRAAALLIAASERED